MLLIAAAMGEELKTGMSLCREKRKMPGRRISLWEARRNEKPIVFLKTGIGPKRSAASLEQALKAIQPSLILMIGYAGALDPNLKLGDLVAVEKAIAFSLDKNNPSWDHILFEGAFELSHSQSLAKSANSFGLRAYAGDGLTSAYVLGDPTHKRLLYERFHASIVDMETAALARVAASRNVPFSCVRAVSDEAADTFLAPFSYDPATRVPARTRKLISTGMVKAYRQWKNHTAIASKSLSRFLSNCL
jgi:nucleoside phosphorylase